LGLSLSLLSSFSIIFPNFYHEGRGKIEVTTYAKTANPQTYAINENCLVGREVKKKKKKNKNKKWNLKTTTGAEDTISFAFFNAISSSSFALCS
jgi:hypothetical protein